MTTRTVKGRVLHLSLAAALMLLSACKDTLSDATLAPVPSMQPTVQLALMTTAAADSVITVELRVNGVSLAGAKAVSLTAAVVYDTMRLRFLNDESPSDGALRAVNAARGRVMIAAAHATGFSDEVYAKLRFVARDARAHESLSLQLNELHLADATDMRGRTTVLPLVVIK